MYTASQTRRHVRLPYLQVYRLILWWAAFALYAATTVRDILPADSGEFQLAAATWDILHPPGYPLYTMVSALWVRSVPFGSLPFRLNLLSAALAATTLLLTAETARLWGETLGARRRFAVAGGLAAALLLAAAPTFWTQATIANIRMPTLLFAAWAFLALAHYDQAAKGIAPQHQKATSLVELALAVGLGAGHHPSLVFVALGWLVFLLIIDPALLWQPRRWWRAALILVATWGAPQLYLPLRGVAAESLQLAPQGLNSWSGFWYHVLARGFAGDMFAFANPTALALRLPLLSTLFTFQFAPVFLLVTGLGWIWLLWRHRDLAIGLLISWGVHTFVTLTYRAPQTVEYLMPAYLPIAIAFGLGMTAALGNGGQKRAPSRSLTWVLRLGAGISVAVALLLPIAARLPDFAILAADTSVRDRVAPLLENAPDGALILADWRWATPLWILQNVEGQNPGAEVVYVYPEAGMEYEDVWRARAENAGGRPLFTTHAYTWEGWTSAPLGGGYRLFRRPLTGLPDLPGLLPLDVALGPVKLLGYRLAGIAAPGKAIELQLAWQATGNQEPAPSFTTRLFDPGGNLVAQHDLWLGSDTAQGEIRFAVLPLQLPVERCPGAVTLNVGVYTVADGAFNNLGDASLAELPVASTYPTLPTGHPWPGVVLGTGPFLHGVDYDVNGDQAWAYLHWCGPGKVLTIVSNGVQAQVGTLSLGECQTVRLPVQIGVRPTLTFEGARTLLSRPLPVPQVGDVYVPFGDQLVLVDLAMDSRGGQTVVDLTWRGVQPLVNDYAVSVRLHDGAGAFLGAHDMQPALSDVPTLKWTVSGVEVLDPHPFPDLGASPATITIAVYERFRLTTLQAGDQQASTRLLAP